MSDQQKPMPKRLHDLTPRSRQAIRFLIATTVGAALFGLSALTLTGTAICLILVTPVLVFLSPIIVPSGALIFLIIVGFLFSGGCGMAALAALAWLYNYAAGKHPPGADQLDYARMKIASTARDVKERAKEYGQSVQPKAQDSTQVS